MEMKITTFTKIKEADKVPEKCSTSGSDLAHFICFLLTFCFFYCCLATLFFLNKIKEDTILPIKGAIGVRTPSGPPIKAVWHCPDCPEQPGLCPGECFEKFHTKFDFTK